MECRQVSTLEHEGELMKLVRDSGRVLNGAPQFVGRPEGERQWQADVGIFCPARFCGGSRADLLLERQSTALLPSCATHLFTFSSFENARPLQSKDYELQPSNYTTERLIPTFRRQHKLLLRFCLARERFCFLHPSRASFVLSLSLSAAILDILYLFFRSTTIVGIFPSFFFFFRAVIFI